MSNPGRLEDILVSHYKKYPHMQIQDMVKLVYQNEFAGGHLISNEVESLERLEEELSGIYDASGTSDTEAIYSDVLSSKTIAFEVHHDLSDRHQLFEDIGNGLCRLNLHELILHGGKGRIVSLETINKFFVCTANSINGSMTSFGNKLEILRDLCKEGSLPYDVSTLDKYILANKNMGCPPVSHTPSYREEYSPAYRVVDSVFRDYFEVFCRIDTLLYGSDKQPAGIKLKTERAVNVAVDGNSGAGKSSLAALLQEIYDCNVFHMDHFFLTPDLKTEERLKEVGGNVDYVRFKNEVIEGLQSGKEFSYQIYDCSNGTLDQAVRVMPKRLNIIEGSYSMHPILADVYDLKIFLGIDEKEQSRRILERNGAFMHERFISLWIPLENRYFSDMNISAQCDIVIYNESEDPLPLSYLIHDSESVGGG